MVSLLNLQFPSKLQNDGDELVISERYLHILHFAQLKLKQNLLKKQGKM